MYRFLDVYVSICIGSYMYRCLGIYVPKCIGS